MTAPDQTLHCPWCGPMNGHYGYTVTRFGTRLTCFCCDSHGPRAPTQDEAKAAWNTRAAPAQPAPDAWDELVAEAITEAEKAMRKFPQPNYVISKIAEEAGEVVKAAIHAAEGRETLENLRGEMKQTIAMLYRLWVEGDQVHGLPPVAGVKECKA